MNTSVHRLLVTFAVVGSQTTTKKESDVDRPLHRLSVHILDFNKTDFYFHGNWILPTPFHSIKGISEVHKTITISYI